MAQERTSFFRAGAVVEADAGEIGRDDGRWICEPSPAPALPPLVPPPGTGHSCEERFVEAARDTRAQARLALAMLKKPTGWPKNPRFTVRCVRTRASLPWDRHADHFIDGLADDGALRIGATALPVHLLLLAVVVVVVVGVTPTATAAAAATAVVVRAGGLRRRGRRRGDARRAPRRGLVARRELLLGVVVVVAEALVGGVVGVVPASAGAAAVEHEPLAPAALGARRVPGAPAAAPAAAAVAPEAPPRRRPARDGHAASPAVPDPVHLRSETCGADPRQITAASPDSDEHRRLAADPGSSASGILANLAPPPRTRRRRELLGSRSLAGSSSTTLCCYLAVASLLLTRAARLPPLLHLPSPSLCKYLCTPFFCDFY